MLSLFLAVGFAIAFGSLSAEACFCTADYRPFCGTDGKTYSNKCELECAQRNNPSLKVKFEGVCPVPYVPGKGGNTNQNQGSESRYNPKYVQPPRQPQYNQNQNQVYYPRQPSQPNNNYYQPTQKPYQQPPKQTYPVPNQNYQPSYQPTQKPYVPQQPYQPSKQTFQPKPVYTTLPPRQNYYQPPQQSFQPEFKTTPPPRQTYYQPRPANQGQSWAPTFGG